MNRHRKWLVTGIVGLALSCGGYVVVAPPVPRRAVIVHSSRGTAVEIGFFYDRLAVYGEWYRHSAHGWVWTPHGVPLGWRPYTRGYWAYTDDDDWLWVSEWEWGWAPFHYGRWFYDDHYGWSWVPGRVWAPAWVAWRHGGGYVGWAPLPPEVVWDAAYGYRHLDVRVFATTRWVFVQDRWFVDRDLRRRILPDTRGAAIVERTRHVSRVTSRGGRPHDRSIVREEIETATESGIGRVRVESVPSPWGEVVRTPQNGTVRIFRPEVRAGPADRDPPPPDALDRRHAIERAELEERHGELLTALNRRYRAADVARDRTLRQRVEAERREVERQIDRERRVLQERQAREKRRRPAGW